MTETRTAVMLMGYGTPRTPADILPYYTDIRRGNPPIVPATRGADRSATRRSAGSRR